MWRIFVRVFYAPTLLVQKVKFGVWIVLIKLGFCPAGPCTKALVKWRNELEAELRELRKRQKEEDERGER